MTEPDQRDAHAAELGQHIASQQPESLVLHDMKGTVSLLQPCFQRQIFPYDMCLDG